MADRPIQLLGVRLSDADREELLDVASRFYDAGECGLRPDTYAPDLLACVEQVVERHVAAALTTTSTTPTC